MCIFFKWFWQIFFFYLFKLVLEETQSFCLVVVFKIYFRILLHENVLCSISTQDPRAQSGWRSSKEPRALRADLTHLASLVPPQDAFVFYSCALPPLSALPPPRADTKQSILAWQPRDFLWWLLYHGTWRSVVLTGSERVHTGLQKILRGSLIPFLNDHWGYVFVFNKEIP